MSRHGAELPGHDRPHSKEQYWRCWAERRPTPSVRAPQLLKERRDAAPWRRSSPVSWGETLAPSPWRGPSEWGQTEGFPACPVVGKQLARSLQKPEEAAAAAGGLGTEEPLPGPQARPGWPSILFAVLLPLAPLGTPVYEKQGPKRCIASPGGPRRVQTYPGLSSTTRVPFSPDTDLTGRPPRVFNYRLSRAKRVAENTFGILAQRWRILHRPFAAKEETTDRIVAACVVLHNFLMKHSEVSERSYVPPGCVDGEDWEGELVKGQWRSEKDEGSGLTDVPPRGTRCTDQAYSIREYLSMYFEMDGKVPWQDEYLDRQN
ncbi:uncharacterized protein ISCGN_015997 [Ixodes scapularis]